MRRAFAAPGAPMSTRRPALVQNQAIQHVGSDLRAAPAAQHEGEEGDAQDADLATRAIATTTGR